ncbi:MAG: hypothetical protein Q9182_005125 [Xanthomendoza sp. 2 TL-2023]
MSPTPVINGTLALAKTTNAMGPISHSSPIAISFAWALTALVPVPLIVLIFLLCYYPNHLPACLSRAKPPHERRTSKRLGFSFSKSRSASTPSSRTLELSHRSSYTLPALSVRPTTPPGHERIPTNPDPSTPQKSSTDSQENSTTPSTSKTTPNSTTTPWKPNLGYPTPSNLLCPASESPRSLSFLEPTSVSSTPRRSYPRRPIDEPPKATAAHAVDSPPASRLVQRRDLKRRFLLSAFCLVLVVGLYILEFFAVAAATAFAHVRVLSHAHGKGGLGNGKEDERWLLPWIVYLFVQGPLALASAWMVFRLWRKLKQFDRDFTNEKGKGVEQPTEDVSGDIELQALGGQENDAFLPTDQEGPEDLPHPVKKGKGVAAQDDEEVEWESLGFRRTSASTEQPASSSNTHDAELASALQQSTCFINPNGEGSSSGHAYSVGPSFDERDLGVPAAFLPGTVSHWRGERSSAEIKLQRRNSISRQLRRDSRTDIPPSKHDRTSLLREGFTAAPPIGDTRNSWEQDGRRVEELSTPETGKGKETKPSEPEEPKPPHHHHHPKDPPTFDLPTGIDLTVDYKFTDGLAYPLLPLRDRHRKTAPTTPPLEPPTPFLNQNNNDIAYPFPIPAFSPTSSPLNPTRRLHIPTHRAFAFEKTPSSPYAPSPTFHPAVRIPTSSAFPLPRTPPQGRSPRSSLVEPLAASARNNPPQRTLSAGSFRLARKATIGAFFFFSSSFV